MVKSERGELSPEHIVQTNALLLGRSLEDVFSRSRKIEDVVFRRRIISELLQSFNVAETARAMRLDSSTISHHRRRIFAGETVDRAVSEQDLQEASLYIEEHFAGRNFDSLRVKRALKKNIFPQCDLIRHLFYKNGLSSLNISGMLGIGESKVVRIINQDEQSFLQKAEIFNNAEEQRLKLQKEKEVREKESQERKDIERRNQIFTQVTFNVVAEHYSVDSQDIISKGRLKIFAQPRKTIQFILFKGTDFNYRQIASLVGRSNDHSTVIYSIKTVERRMEIDPEFRERVEEMLATINRLTNEVIQAEKNPKENVASS